MKLAMAEAGDVSTVVKSNIPIAKDDDDDED
jgi:hypothetical protein